VQGRVCGARQTLHYYATRDAMDIEHLGDKIIDQVVAAGLVTDPADLYDLDVPTLLPLDRMGEVSAGKLVASIQGSKDRPLSKVLTALGMRMAGRAMCRRLAATFGTMDAVLAASVADLQRVDGVGPERAATIVAELADYRPVIEKLMARGVRMTEPVQVVAASLPLQKPDGSPMKVVVTGAIPGLTRDEGNAAVERLGGSPSGSVSAKTDLVVVGEGAGSKAVKAEQLGVRIMPAQEFADLLS
jgi:DNA ligase (NAD+)